MTSDAMQRVCEEIERVVWPIDRKYEDEGRRFWVRPAEPIEISQRELEAGLPWIPKPGDSTYVVVRAVGAGIRERLVFVARDLGEGWRTLPEAECCNCYTWALTNVGRTLEIEPKK